MADATAGGEPAQEPLKERNLDGYGEPPLQWSRVLDRLGRGVPQAPGTGGPDRHTCWLATVGPGGAPHVRPLGALWLDGAFYFNSGPATRKARNLAADPRCVLTVATTEFDLVVEGTAEKVGDAALLRRVADEYAREGWPARVEDGALHADYSAPSAGPPPWEVYRVRPAKVVAVATAQPFGATAWDF